MSDAMVICPSCTKSWPRGTAFCQHCTTSLHHAKSYVAMSATPAFTSNPREAVLPRAPLPRVVPIADDALERVRANGYWVLRLRATRMTLIGYLQL